MSPPRDALDTYRRAMEPLIGVPLAEPQASNVTGFLEMAAAAADLYLDFPLDDAYDEAAPVFTPKPLATGVDAQ